MHKSLEDNQMDEWISWKSPFQTLDNTNMNLYFKNLK